MNQLEISFAEPASVINEGLQASSFIQDAHKVLQNESEYVYSLHIIFRSIDHSKIKKVL